MICPIHKKGDVTTCDNYRTVTLLCTAYKIPTNILYVKLVPYAEEIIGEHQGGLRRERSAADQIFLLKDKYLKNVGENNTDVHYLFIDFQAAYGTVWRKEIWSEMQEVGYSEQKKS
jgi:Reverse transcriptase (RNA-dependent DNA polymerase).